MIKPSIDTSHIITSYLSGKSVLALSHEYECYTQDIQKILDKNNISKISQAKRNNPYLIEDYFNVIDNNNKAYWLGWLLSDGSVSKKNDIEIVVSKKDEYILHLLENDIGITGHVKDFGEAYCRFSFSCTKMTDHLKQYGIVPNKTLDIIFPTNIQKQYETHLLRGLFDGDGGFTIGNTTRFYQNRNRYYTRPYQELSFTGTYDMCNNFQKTLLNYVDINIKNITHNHSIYRVRWSKKEEIIKICNILYRNAGTHKLVRKYQLYQRLQNLKEVL